MNTNSKIVWDFNLEPSNLSQNHYIYDKDWNWKTLWMKEQLEKKEDNLLKIYIDVSKENYFDEFIKEIENYIEQIWKKDLYNEDIKWFIYDWELNINSFQKLALYLQELVDFGILEKTNKLNIAAKIVLFIDNCDKLDDNNKQDLNSLIWYRERNTIYFIWIKWERKDYILYTNFSEIVLTENNDFYSRKIIDIL